MILDFECDENGNCRSLYISELRFGYYIQLEVYRVGDFSDFRGPSYGSVSVLRSDDFGDFLLMLTGTQKKVRKKPYLNMRNPKVPRKYHIDSLVCVESELRKVLPHRNREV